jgi:hypothetical protein
MIIKDEFLCGHKANFIKEFFKENNAIIIRNGTAYVLDEIVYDDLSIPEQIEPDELFD